MATSVILQLIASDNYEKRLHVCQLITYYIDLSEHATLILYALSTDNTDHSTQCWVYRHYFTLRRNKRDKVVCRQNTLNVFYLSFHVHQHLIHSK